MKLAGHIACMEKGRDANRCLVEKHEGNTQLGKPNHRWEVILKLIFINTGGVDVGGSCERGN
jgi:hypothetical protein